MAHGVSCESYTDIQKGRFFVDALDLTEHVSP